MATNQPEQSAPPRWRPWTSGRWRVVAIGLAMELVVVFVGVYAASSISDHQKQQQDDARRNQIRQGLIREITGITANTRHAATQIRGMLIEFDTAIKLKRYPPLQPWLEPVRFQTHMWQATLQSGALDLFDIPTVYRMSEFYNELNEGFEQIDQLRTLSEQYLLTAADSPATTFYNLQTGRLRPSYQWYFAGLRNLRNVAESITQMGDSLLVDLQRGQRPAPDTTPPQGD